MVAQVCGDDVGDDDLGAEPRVTALGQPSQHDQSVNTEKTMFLDTQFFLAVIL
jgi:hypothetical protein